MTSRLPITTPCVGDPELAAVAAVLRSGWLTQGQRVQEFEEQFAATVGARHACAVSNCTSALHLGLRAIGVGPGDVVVTVSHSFVATANAIRTCGAEPVFVDVDLGTLNMSSDALQRCIARCFEKDSDGVLRYGEVDRLTRGESPLVRLAGPTGRLAGVLVVHQVGMPADLGSILRVAREAGVKVVEDAACATGSEVVADAGHGWSPVGAPHGEVACFSFHPRKVITTGEGGMLTHRDSAIDREFRLLRQHGMTRSDLERHRAESFVQERYVRTAFNYRMTDIQAAIGIEQLKRLREIVARRRELASHYRRLLADLDGIDVQTEPEYARSNWQSFVVRLRDPKRRCTVANALRNAEIDCRPGIMCSHLESPYQPQWPQGSLPNSEAAQSSALILPLFPSMATGDVDRVVGVVETALAE